MRALSVIVQLLAWLAPRSERERWREEWLAELHQIAEARGRRAACRVALGLAADAIALRRLAAERARLHPNPRHSFMIFSRADSKLALRMLVRSPGLTMVGVLGMSVGITIAAAALTIVAALMNPALPFDEGDRIVALGYWDARTNNQEQRVLHDLGSWRGELRSVEDVGAVRMVSRNLITPDAQPETVSVAEISASAFRVTRVSPTLGRPLLADDERTGARDVVVIGDDVWKRRFGGDTGVIGRDLQLGSRRHTIVGIMPPGYGFPVAHNYWIPLRLAASYEPLTGPSVTVFGRLAADATLETARAEVAALGVRMAATSPRTHQHLRAQLFPYTHVFTDMDDPDGALVMRVMQTTIILILTVVCVNVAILVYARTATRQGEIAVRSALGASRGRIVSQLFVEALALAGVAAVVAMGLLSIGFTQLTAALRQLAIGFPFWLKFEVSGMAVLYILLLTIFSAAIVGVVPALKATGRRVQTGLQGLSAGSGSRMQMGRVWTLLIVAQVAITVAVLPGTVYHAWNTLRFRAAGSGFASHEFLTTELTMERASDQTPSPEVARQFRLDYGLRLRELERRLETESAVSQVTYSLAPPGGELAAIVEVEGTEIPPRAVNYNIVEGARQGHLIRFNRVSLDYFDAFGVPVLTGRSLRAGDAGGVGVLVDRTFVEQLLGGQNPLGRQIRYVGRSREAGEGNVTLQRSYEIVGVVNDFPPHAAGGGPAEPRIYHAAGEDDMYPAELAVRIRGAAPETFSSRLRQLAAGVDPALQPRSVSTAEQAMRREQGLMRLIGVTLVAVIGSVVALSAAGIYALMAFTVARRRKEIGIRAALGADQKQILAGVFSRAAAQLTTGAVLGLAGSAALEGVFDGEMFQGHGAVILPLVAVFMTAVGLLAALGPARRGLRVHPMEALRAE